MNCRQVGELRSRALGALVPSISWQTTSLSFKLSYVWVAPLPDNEPQMLLGNKSSINTHGFRRMKASKTQKGFRPPPPPPTPTRETREIIGRDNADCSQFKKCASRTFWQGCKRNGRPVFLQSFIGVQIGNIRRVIVYLLLRKYRIKNNKEVRQLCKDSDFAGEVKLGS